MRPSTLAFYTFALWVACVQVHGFKDVSDVSPVSGATSIDVASIVERLYSLEEDEVPTYFAPDAVCFEPATGQLPWNGVHRGQDCVLQVARMYAKLVTARIQLEEVLVDANPYALRAVAWVTEHHIIKATGAKSSVRCAHLLEFNARLKVSRFTDLCDTLSVWQSLPHHPDGEPIATATSGVHRKLAMRRGAVAATVKADANDHHHGNMADSVEEQSMEQEEHSMEEMEVVDQVVEAGTQLHTIVTPGWPSDAARARLRVLSVLVESLETGQAEHVIPQFFSSSAVCTVHTAGLLPWKQEHTGRHCMVQYMEAVFKYIMREVQVEDIFISSNDKATSVLAWVAAPSTNALTKKKYTGLCAYHLTFNKHPKSPMVTRVEEVCNTLLEFDNFPHGFKPPPHDSGLPF